MARAHPDPASPAELPAARPRMMVARAALPRGRYDVRWCDMVTPGRAGVRADSLELRLLGRFRVSVGGSPVDERAWGRGAAVMLVKLLALEPNHRMHREALMEALWPEQAPASAVNNLSKAIHAARRALEPGLASGRTSRFLSTESHTVSLGAPGGLWVDLDVFERLAAEARAAENAEVFEAALALYEGPLLADDPYDDRFAARREHASRLHAVLLSGAARAHAAAGEPGRAARRLEALVAADPLDEEAGRRLMALYARAGERGRALLHFERLRDELDRELGVAPSAETFEVYRAIARGAAPAAESPARPAGPRPAPPGDAGPPTNLPFEATRFVGRARDIRAVGELLASSRLVTLLGTGGIGKTRLALEAASALRGRFPDGVWFADLSTIASAEQLPATVAAAVGCREERGRPASASIARALGGGTVLLVLDNCEHVADACAALAAGVLAACPGARVLATSQAALGLGFEARYAVGPLELPPRRGAGDVAGYDAVGLFLERARLRRPDLDLSGPKALEAAAEVCRRLDGIPLAIELAAAAASMLSVEQIGGRLAEGDALPAGARAGRPRHRTMRAAIDWSHERLDARERTMFAGLAVFAGGFDLDAAQAAGRAAGVGGDEAIALLGGLIDKSLVAVDAGGARARYRLLEPLRAYALGRLRESGGEAAAREAHLEWFLEFAAQAGAAVAGPAEAAWVRRIVADAENLRAAMEWAIDRGRAESALEIACGVSRVNAMVGNWSESRRLLERALGRTTVAPTPLRARALHSLGSLERRLGEYARSARTLDAAVAVWRAVNHANSLARALLTRLMVADDTGDYDRARAMEAEVAGLLDPGGDPVEWGLLYSARGMRALYLDDPEAAGRAFESALDHYRTTGAPGGVMVALQNLGEVALLRGDAEGAVRLFESSLEHAREFTNAVVRADSFRALARVALARGEPERAVGLCREAADVCLAQEDQLGALYTLEALAECALAQGAPAKALRLASAALKARESLGVALHPADARWHDELAARAGASLAPGAADAAAAAGRALGVEDAFAHAFAAGEDGSGRRSASG